MMKREFPNAQLLRNEIYSVKRSDIVFEARSWLGTPYHHQASVKSIGCDCLGLVRGVYTKLMRHDPETPPPYSKDWAEALKEETLLLAAGRYLNTINIQDRTQGDVVIFRFRKSTVAKHAGILTERDRMIHATEKANVAEVHLSHWWQRRIAGVYQFPGVIN
ncbi:MAG: NlpC/P60 family protein [Pseudomonadota bacterium]